MFSASNVAGAEVRDESVIFGQSTNSNFGALIDALIFEIKKWAEKYLKKRERRNRDCLADNEEKFTPFLHKGNFLFFFNLKIRPKLAFFKQRIFSILTGQANQHHREDHVDAKKSNFWAVLMMEKFRIKLISHFLNLTFLHFQQGHSLYSLIQPSIT